MASNFFQFSLITLNNNIPLKLHFFFSSIHLSFIPSFISSFLPSYLLLFVVSFVRSCLPSCLPVCLSSSVPCYLQIIHTSLDPCILPATHTSIHPSIHRSIAHSIMKCMKLFQPLFQIGQEYDFWLIISGDDDVAAFRVFDENDNLVSSFVREIVGQYRMFCYHLG